MTPHQWMQIGTTDSEGFRTHTTPGDVCVECSAPSIGKWVPVSQCKAAMITWEQDHQEEPYV